MANHTIFSSIQIYRAFDLLTVMDIDLNNEFTSALRTVMGMYFIIKQF